MMTVNASIAHLIDREVTGKTVTSVEVQTKYPYDTVLIVGVGEGKEAVFSLKDFVINDNPEME